MQYIPNSKSKCVWR